MVLWVFLTVEGDWGCWTYFRVFRMIGGAEGVLDCGGRFGVLNIFQSVDYVWGC